MGLRLIQPPVAYPKKSWQGLHVVSRSARSKLWPSAVETVCGRRAALPGKLPGNRMSPAARIIRPKRISKDAVLRMAASRSFVGVRDAWWFQNNCTSGPSQTAVALIGRAGAVEQSDGFQFLGRRRPGLVAWFSPAQGVFSCRAAFQATWVITRDEA